jgi:SPP1 family predicted phage head-tail adaptor
MPRKLLNSGTLRHRIEIQEPVEVQDSDTGDITEEWVTVDGCDSVPAEIAPLSAREFLAASAIQSKVVARIMIRYRAGLTAKMRILHRGTIYNIEGVLADADSGLEYLNIPVSQGVNDG